MFEKILIAFCFGLLTASQNGFLAFEPNFENCLAIIQEQNISVGNYFFLYTFENDNGILETTSNYTNKVTFQFRILLQLNFV